MSNRDKKDYSFRFKLNRANKKFSFVSGQDRRSGIDRRRLPVRNYLLNGFVERRSWAERRFLWYMTM